MKPYREMTWVEVGEAAARDPVVLIPVGTLEDHGRHLPIDTDVLIAEELCRHAAEQLPDETVLFPPVIHGYSPHHEDFPGSINIRWNIFVEYLLDITRSLVRHGFRRLLLLNGHGSNNSLVDIAARLTIVEHPHVLCAKSFYLTSHKGREVLARVRQSEYPGGMAHACELETSLYLALKPDLVNMREAVRDINYPPSDYIWFDWEDGPVSMMEWWSTISHTGTMGDPTVATADKGRLLLDAAIAEVVEIVKELKRRPIRPRVDHHGGLRTQEAGLTERPSGQTMTELQPEALSPPSSFPGVPSGEIILTPEGRKQ